MNLVVEDAEILMNRIEDFDFSIEHEHTPVEIAEALVKYMVDHNGIGLAANQLGLPYRAFAMKTQPNTVCFNPLIVDRSAEVVTMEEGCLSYPGLIIKVKRPQAIKVRFTQPNGEVRTKKFTGMTSRVFQHELDHLNGIVFYRRANDFHKDQAFRARKLWQRTMKKRGQVESMLGGMKNVQTSTTNEPTKSHQ